jgi:hypothetical protein
MLVAEHVSISDHTRSPLAVPLRIHGGCTNPCWQVGMCLYQTTHPPLLYPTGHTRDIPNQVGIWSIPDHTHPPLLYPAGYTGGSPNHDGSLACVYTRPHTPTSCCTHRIHRRHTKDGRVSIPDQTRPHLLYPQGTQGVAQTMWQLGVCIYQTKHAHFLLYPQDTQGTYQPCWQLGVCLYQTTHAHFLLYPQDTQGVAQPCWPLGVCLYQTTQAHTCCTPRVHRG